ncbi:WD repeat-containing protein 18 [Zancudomyces culisetae]|uniref:WD repeat-containing protein 18 n=1 Tax=Zancudomyces culisetae TaxID=1213189 RepID=A0A1R1PW13_ZANCU|nr:WD repeat-containing protein 18 [Zancudomyces culisetae]|eukprot:OMH85093.1 WD repeat-containing protein 18 [Zancudomyces culisetae]
MFSEIVVAGVADTGNIHVYELRSGTPLAILANAQIDSPFGFCITEKSNARSHPWLFAVPSHTALAQLYTFGWAEQNSKIKFPLPEKIKCVAVSNNGEYVFGGSENGRLYIWSSSSGILLKAWDAHYGCVNVITVSNDGSTVLSGGDDAEIHVWLLSSVLDLENSEPSSPETTLSGHTMPILSIVVGPVGNSEGHFYSGGIRIFSSSKDRSVRCWKLVGSSANKRSTHMDSTTQAIDKKPYSAELLTTWLLPNAVECIVVDPAETKIFTGCQDGNIYQINLYNFQQEAVAGGPIAVGGNNAVVEVGLAAKTKSNTSLYTRAAQVSGSSHNEKVFQGHGGAIQSLSLSMDATLLVSGSKDSTIKIWDTTSRQCIRTITEAKKRQNTANGTQKGTLGGVHSGVPQVVVTLRGSNFGGVKGVVDSISGGGIVSYGLKDGYNTSHSQLRSASATSKTLKAPLISPFKRVQTPTLDLSNPTEQHETGQLSKFYVKDTRELLSDFPMSPRLSIFSSLESEFSTSLFGDLRFSSSILSEKLDRDSQNSLKNKVESLKSDLLRLAEHQQKIRSLNDSFYQSAVTSFLSNRKANLLNKAEGDPISTLSEEVNEESNADDGEDDGEEGNDDSSFISKKKARVVE